MAVGERSQPSTKRAWWLDHDLAVRCSGFYSLHAAGSRRSGSEQDKSVTTSQSGGGVAMGVAREARPRGGEGLGVRRYAISHL